MEALERAQLSRRTMPAPEVLIVEKNDGGGNTKLATRTFISPENSRAAQQHVLALSMGMLDEKTIDFCLRWMSQNNDFVRELGGEVEICPPGATFPSLPGAETMIRYRVKASESERGGESLWNLLARNVEARKIRIHRRTAVTKLLRAEDEIIGVEADQAGQRIRIGAKRAVVLATGGFEYNEEMKQEFL